jgi:hypothetical protein
MPSRLPWKTAWNKPIVSSHSNTSRPYAKNPSWCRGGFCYHWRYLIHDHSIRSPSPLHSSLTAIHSFYSLITSAFIFQLFRPGHYCVAQVGAGLAVFWDAHSTTIILVPPFSSVQRDPPFLCYGACPRRFSGEERNLLPCIANVLCEGGKQYPTDLTRNFTTASQRYKALILPFALC